MGAELETLFRLQELDLRLLEKQGEIDRFERRLSDRRKQLEQTGASDWRAFEPSASCVPVRGKSPASSRKSTG